MQVPPYPGRGVGLPWQQPAGAEEGCIPGRLGMVLGAPIIGAGCRLMGLGPFMSAQLKQPVGRERTRVSACALVATNKHRLYAAYGCKPCYDKALVAAQVLGKVDICPCHTTY